MTLPVVVELLVLKRLQEARAGFHIIDVGCGRGGTGAVAMAYQAPFIARIVGLEAHAAFGTQPGSQWASYGKVRLCDAREELPRMVLRQERYDVGFCTEVLEHNPRDDALRMLDLLPFIADEWLVTVPDREVGVADAHTPFQAHVSQLEAADFLERGWDLLHPRPDGWTWNDLGWPMHMAHRGPTDLGQLQLVRVERASGHAEA